MSVVNNVKKARIEMHIRQEDLAKAIGCSVDTISRSEAGKRCPSLELALRMAA